MSEDDKLTTLLQNTEQIKGTLRDVLSLTDTGNIPLGLKKIFQDTFICTICNRVPIKPPLIVTKCCKSILGCEECTNEWYSGPDAPNKTCPKCRAERGYTETMRLHGMDEVLQVVEKMTDKQDV